MLPWNQRRLRFFTGCAAFLLATANISVSLAQPETVPDPSVPPPAADATTPPLYIPATPAAQRTQATSTSQQTSAATIVSDSSQPETGGALSAGGGPTPVVGPGAAPETTLGSDISSAALSKKLPFRVTATLGEIYNNNIFSRVQKEGDFITKLAVTGEYRTGDLKATDGNYFDFVYTPSLHLYARHSHETGVDQNVDAFYGHHWTKLTLSLEQIYQKTQETDASIGGLVTADKFTTVAQAKFIYSPNLDIILTGRQDIIDYDQPAYTDTKEWSGTLYALYHVDPKLAVGFGPRIGYLNIDMSPNETYQQFLARLFYDPTEKLHFQGTAGAEDRQYQTVGRSDTLEPVFELDGVYLPNPSTTLTLNTSRRFEPSYNVLGQDYIATNVSVSAKQRFFQAYFLALTAGYENDEYQNVTPMPGAQREDDYFYLQPSLTWAANGWLKVSAFDRYAEDNSNFDIFTYDTNQVGVSISATY